MVAPCKSSLPKTSAKKKYIKMLRSEHQKKKEKKNILMRERERERENEVREYNQER